MRIFKSSVHKQLASMVKNCPAIWKILNLKNGGLTSLAMRILLFNRKHFYNKQISIGQLTTKCCLPMAKAHPPPNVHLKQAEFKSLNPKKFQIKLLQDSMLTKMLICSLQKLKWVTFTQQSGAMAPTISKVKNAGWTKL